MDEPKASKSPPHTEDLRDLPFPLWDGKGVRVGVIDSGVNERHPHIMRVAGGISVGEQLAADYIDVLGHGTAVMAAMQEKAPAADYFAVKLFQSSLRARLEDLLRALEWCVANRMDVVNLSLATSNEKYSDAFLALCGRACEQGVALVCAARAGQPCSPARLPDALRVDVDPKCPRNRYRVHDGIFLTSGYPRPIPGVPPERNLQGISFAVANMTGFIARARQGMSSAELTAGLAAEAARMNRNNSSRP
jgi:subtilisin family serine protease